ncbi:MAG: methylmalonyl-CoA epimerase [Candidatus Cloacimonetes bacterium]|jgi:methylmalonyl-CoA epimerase|nr:methylmalonyl-CoA epimerase [Candidatus Cloacimonadota bacterium]MDD4156365.1 methylmalonyl-CoA epimerase [Candidatus Cloacimonadota bacterium]
MIKKISHIGIAVKNLDEAVKFYEKLGLQVEAYEVVPSQKVKVAFIPIGDTRIELLSATSEDSPIAKFIEKKGEGIQHIALAVDDLPKALSEAEKQEIVLIDKEPRPGAHGADIAFLHPKSTNGVLLELCKEKH